MTVLDGYMAAVRCVRDDEPATGAASYRASPGWSSLTGTRTTSTSEDATQDRLDVRSYIDTAASNGHHWRRPAVPR